MRRPPQPDLFMGLSDAPGSLACGVEICAVMSAAIDQARDRGISREDICLRMSCLLSENVSVAMLNAYTAKSRETHEISLRRAMAFDAATETDCLLALYVSKRGLRVVTEEEAAYIELGRIQHQEKELSERKKLARLQIEQIQRGRK
jgi:hypothetical protein